MDRVSLFNVLMSNVCFDELCDAMARNIEQRVPGYAVTPNVDHICRYQRDARFRACYEKASWVVPDGVPIVWASYLAGKPLREKLSGSDLVPRLSEVASQHGFSVYFFGAAPGVAQSACDVLRTRYPTLRVAGVWSPSMQFGEDAEENAGVINQIKTARPDICFVALGSPKQEYWILDNYVACDVPVMLGIGAGLDFVAGTAARAPRFIQRIGLEWCWRLAHEPRRLWRRYLVEDSLFIVLLFRELASRFRRAPSA